MTKEAELKPVYLIISEQKLLVDEAVERLKRRIGEAGDLDFNLQVFEAEGVNADDVIVACNTMPFAAERRLVIVRGVEKLAKDASEAICDYAADPSPTAVLALTGEKLAKNTRLYKAVDKLGGVLERKLDKKELPSHIKRMFEDRGKAISYDAVQQLIAAVGPNLSRLSVEVDKAIAYVGERGEVTGADIDGVISTTAATSIWEFTDAIGSRDCRRALSTASALIGEGESVFGLHAMALRTIRDLIMARSLLDRGVTGVSAIAREFGRPDWLVKKVVAQARGFSSEELVDLLREAAAGEAKMKTSRDARLVLERWIVKICG